MSEEEREEFFKSPFTMLDANLHTTLNISRDLHEWYTYTDARGQKFKETYHHFLDRIEEQLTYQRELLAHLPD